MHNDTSRATSASRSGPRARRCRAGVLSSAALNATSSCSGGHSFRLASTQMRHTACLSPEAASWLRLVVAFSNAACNKAIPSALSCGLIRLASRSDRGDSILKTSAAGSETLDFIVSWRAPQLHMPYCVIAHQSVRFRTIPGIFNGRLALHYVSATTKADRRDAPQYSFDIRLGLS